MYKTFLALGIVCLICTTASAQYRGGRYGRYGGYGGYHSSTAEEGIQHGYADVVRSYGMANLLNSQAATQIEQARRAYIENRLKATQTYFEMSRYNAEARRGMRSPPLTMEQYVRLAREQAPEALTATQLDPLTGTISWPVPLRIADYETFRHRIERLFQDRAAGYVQYGEIQRVCGEFLEQLQLDVEKFTPNDYVAVRKFIDSLEWAARGVQS